MTFKELARKLSRKYSDECDYVSSIVEYIKDLIDEGELECMPNICVEKCRSIEIERGYWGYEGVYEMPLSDFVGNPKEKEAVILDITFGDYDNDNLWIDIIPNVDSWDYYVGE